LASLTELFFWALVAFTWGPHCGLCYVFLSWCLLFLFNVCFDDIF